jgi:hypothetical protein
MHKRVIARVGANLFVVLGSKKLLAFLKQLTPQQRIVIEQPLHSLQAVRACSSNVKTRI